MPKISYRARLVPAGKAETYVIHHKTFKKKGRWYPIEDEALAHELAAVRESQINPDSSPFVFQVLRVDAAKQLETQEAVQADPSGSVDAPSVFGKATGKAGPILTKIPVDDPVAEDRTIGDASTNQRLGKNEEAEDEIDEDPEEEAEQGEPKEDADPEEDAEQGEPKEDAPPPAPPKRAGPKKVGKKKAGKKG